ncbi:glycosyltransferase family 2 protein [Allopontixanthobacter sp.]|uniref:glycosyltransferase family 2 protein n=1 Tax=Allopontixanthobacter sp. TaxID=2906452 RepID=UPI002ABB71A9|nr:glycosyltransferase family 2 protein [Allopontixanthobacter sp.]MDZ4307436.1 glycosyltransferase family 2 protein [Allopontixanthobacter sp.]
MPSVDVVIVNWNSGEQLADCVASLLAHDAGDIAAIMVVDNASQDGSADLDFADERLTIIKSSENLGFGKACNMGASYGTAPLILLVNPDCCVRPNSIRGAAEFLLSDTERAYVACGIRLTDAAGQTQRHCARQPRPAMFLAESTGVSRIAPRPFPPVIMTDFDHLSDRDVDHVIGAFYCVRRAAFDHVGGFNPKFFMYMEDLDLSARLRAGNMKIRYLAAPSAFHAGGGTSRQILGRRLGYAMEGRARFSALHFGRGAHLLVLLAMLTAEPLARIGQALASGRAGAIGEVAEGYRVFLQRYFARDAP